MMPPRPAYWGKLPAYGDFLRQQAPSVVQDAWRQWLAGPLSEAAQRSLHAQRYELPWSFVLAPGCLAFSGARYLAGVYLASQDKFGREHPFLLWFLLTPPDLSSLLAEHDNVLFRFGRILRRHTQYEPGVRHAGPSFQDELNRFWRTTPSGILRRRRSSPGTHIWPTLPFEAPADTQSEALQGVTQAPWRDWPAVVFGQPGQAWYWQQDERGGYVSFLSVGDGTPSVII